jgi:hypothetical protein
MGICISLAIAAALCRGVVTLIYTCRVAKVSTTEYLKTTVLPPVISAAFSAAGLYVLVRLYPPYSWSGLVACSVIFTAVFAVTSLPLVGYEYVLLQGRRALDKLREAF